MATDLARLLGANIRAYRKNLSLTQERLADRLEVSTPYLNLLEAGKKFPSEAVLWKLAQTLEVRPYELFVDPLVDSSRASLVSSAVSEDFIAELGDLVREFAQDYQTRHKKG